MVDPALPFRVRQIGTERDATATPAEGRKSADLQKKISIFLAELGGFAPIVNFQARNDRMLRQGGRVEQPGVWNHFLQSDEIFLAQLASPKFPQRLHPKEREPHFFFEIRLDR